MSHDPQHGETPPAQGYPPQGSPDYPPQGYGQQGQPPPGYSPSGYPQQGYPQGYPQQSYPQQGYGAPPTNTMAILALVFAFVFWPLAIVFGHVARKQIATTGEGGRGLATAGLVLGYLFLGFTLIAIIALVALAGAAVSNDPYAVGRLLAT